MTLHMVFDTGWKMRALEGDAEAVRRLAHHALEPLFRFCFYRVGKNRHLCEEVVQQTLFVALRSLDRYEPSRSDGDLMPWLSGLARNEIRRVLARENRGSSLETLWERIDEDLRAIFAAVDSEPFPDEALVREETREMVNATMSQLPTHYREALEAKYVDDRSVREIATVVAMTEKATESLLTRARRAFRETFLALNRNLDIDVA